MCSAKAYKFETLAVTRPRENVLQVEMNRPDKRNAMNQTFWREMVECFDQISKDGDCRAVVLSGAGKIFTAGNDHLMDMAGVLMSSADSDDPARKAIHIRQTILAYQESFTAIEKCEKPVIAAVHSACVGGGVDMICACDIRLCTSDAWFQVKEVELGLAADVGTLQRMPKIVGNESLVRELCYTARRLLAHEAKEAGLVSGIYPNRERVISAALDMAAKIAKMSPVAVTGTKHNLNYSRDHPVDASLKYIATWNMTMLQTEDIMKAAQAMMAKEEATFSKL
ncbi:predicted protein [Nematostella vectensis]|uniref:Delta(3,5)-Delta(2,4)-dienoyl-CoA isomerase, mitochondrial n=1 Tax=Nematostella vectensis TaxID=45351 RepID=A7SDI6_NEMVE|nr:predicted protein [Nematostella vectensis]|eukprot:XP_001630295.1 predicted protein [Nematostella vectensis]